jgi:outer membrane protein OmpA-like peptidoglycan-associated protein
MLFLWFLHKVAVKNFLKFSFVFLCFLSWLFLCRHIYFCQVLGKCESKEKSEKVWVKDIAMTLSVSVDSILVLDSLPEFEFDLDADSSQLQDVHKIALMRMADLLKKQPNARLHIVGRYMDSESKKGYIKNLGLARALVVADYLSSELKVEGSQLITTGELINDSSLMRPIVFDLTGYFPDSILLFEREDEKFRMQWIDSLTIVSYNQVLGNFSQDEKKFRTTPSFLDLVDKLKLITKRDKKLKIEVMGHSFKDEGKNQEAISEEYAKSVADFLKSKGIKASIETKGFGNENPLFNELQSDKSIDFFNQAKNTRVEIRVFK